MSSTYRTTVAEGLQRAARLTPFATRSASNLAGNYGAVCSPWQTMPAELQQAQRDRTAYYMSHGPEEGNRSQPDHAPRYYVTSYGVLIAWVTLDGRTHYAEGIGENIVQAKAMWRHRDAIRASWPERFVMDSQGDPIGRLGIDGRYYTV
jgi:hypothetical protein